MKPLDCEQLTFFPAASRRRVSHFHTPGSEEARRMTVTSGRKCSASLTASSPLGLLAKMLMESSIWRSTMCWLTWKEKATKQGRSYFQLAASAPRTGGTASPLWATPNTMDYLSQRSPEALARQAAIARKGRTRPSNLREQVNPETEQLWSDIQKIQRLWPTPRANKIGGSSGAGFSPSLEEAVKMYATPQARDFRTGQQARWENKNRSRNLNDQIGGKLSVAWVIRLMGFPDGYLDL